MLKLTKAKLIKEIRSQLELAIQNEDWSVIENLFLNISPDEQSLPAKQVTQKGNFPINFKNTFVDDVSENEEDVGVVLTRPINKRDSRPEFKLKKVICEKCNKTFEVHPIHTVTSIGQDGRTNKTYTCNECNTKRQR